MASKPKSKRIENVKCTFPMRYGIEEISESKLFKRL